jgi:alkylhydroperoxidase family enzyme
VTKSSAVGLALSPAMDQIDEAVLSSAGDSDPGLRRAAFYFTRAIAGTGEPPLGADLEEPLRTFVDKVARHAYKVLPEDIDALEQAGFSEDAIFELILATACGAGRARLDIGLACLGKVA